jgi:hypothetical protein
VEIQVAAACALRQHEVGLAALVADELPVRPGRFSPLFQRFSKEIAEIAPFFRAF